MKVKHKFESTQPDDPDYPELVNASNWNEDHDVVEDVSALAIASGVVDIDCEGGDFRTLLLTANVTGITFSNLPAPGEGRSIAIRIKQDSTGGRTVALPSSFKKMGASEAAVQSAANAITILTLMTFDQGVRWEYSMCAGAA
ncbi:hypothetical protein DBA29_17285 [Xenophilus aerolatus]|nr:hypothetical protein [Xenophilus aerolatus]